MDIFSNTKDSAWSSTTAYSTSLKDLQPVLPSSNLAHESLVDEPSKPDSEAIRRINIRIASEDDWSRIEPAYRSVMAPGRYFEYPATERSDQARDRWMQPLPGRTVMALEGDDVVGSAWMGPVGVGPTSHIATWQAWVINNYRSRGIGQFLTDYVLDWAQVRSYHGLLVTGVTSANAAASELLQQNGYDQVGAIPCGFDDPVVGYVDVRSYYREVA